MMLNKNLNYYVTDQNKEKNCQMFSKIATAVSDVQR